MKFLPGLFVQLCPTAAGRFACSILAFCLVLPALTLAQPETFFYEPGENLEQKTAKYLFIKVETNKREALTGEAIEAKYRLYVAVDIEGKLSKSPSFTGFASYDMQSGNEDAYEVEKINGIAYRVYLISQVQLFGLQAGVQQLQPVELEATIRYRKKMPGNAAPSGGKPVADTLLKYVVKSPPVNIVIKKLPGKQPPAFSGGVGLFEFSAFASSPATAPGEADTLHLVLKGRGNWHEISFPQVNWPEGAEVFEPFESNSLNPASVPAEGIRTLSYPVVFGRKGEYTLAPVGFVYYNTQSSQYSTIRSDSIRFTVTDALKPEKRAPATQGGALTGLFSRYAVVIFPVLAVILASLLLWRRRAGDTGQ